MRNFICLLMFSVAFSALTGFADEPSGAEGTVVAHDGKENKENKEKKEEMHHGKKPAQEKKPVEHKKGK